MSGPHPDALPAAVADLHAAAASLNHVAVCLRDGHRYQLASAAVELELLVAGWAALLQAQHERLMAEHPREEPP